MQEGWIKYYRKIKDHWLFKEPRVFSRFEAWTYLLLTANHSDNKFMFDNKLVEVKRGDMITSMEKLGIEWQWSAHKVKNFLMELESDGMITYKPDNKKTTISLTNYCLYQDFDDGERSAEGIQKEDKRRTEEYQRETNNNDKECMKNENKIKYAEYITMTNAEYGKLVGTYGEQDTKRMIEVLDNYKGSKGKKYASDFRAILNWVVKRVLDEKEKAASIPNAQAYKSESKKCPICGDTGWVNKNFHLVKCSCSGGGRNGQS